MLRPKPVETDLSVTVTTPLEHTIHYETASWYTKVGTPIGVFAVQRRASYSDHGRWFPEQWYVELPGVVTASHFVNRVFQHSTILKDEDVGKPHPWKVTLAYKIRGHYYRDPWGRTTKYDALSAALAGEHRMGSKDHEPVCSEVNGVDEADGWPNDGDPPNCSCGAEAANLDHVDTCASLG